MQLGAVLDQAVEMRRRKSCELRGVAFDPVEKIAVANECDLDRLGHAGPLLAIRQTIDESAVVDDGPGRRESSDQVLQSERIDRILHANAAVVLRENSGRKTDMAHAAMKNCRCIAYRIQYRTAADRDHERVTVDGEARKLSEQEGHDFRIVLAALAAEDRNDRTCCFEAVRMNRRIFRNAAHKIGLRRQDAVIDENGAAVELSGLFTRQGFDETAIARVERVASENYGVFVINVKGLESNVADDRRRYIEHRVLLIRRHFSEA